MYCAVTYEISLFITGSEARGRLRVRRRQTKNRPPRIRRRRSFIIPHPLSLALWSATLSILTARLKESAKRGLEPCPDPAGAAVFRFSNAAYTLRRISRPRVTGKRRLPDFFERRGSALRRPKSFRIKKGRFQTTLLALPFRSKSACDRKPQ